MLNVSNCAIEVCPVFGLLKVRNSLCFIIVVLKNKTMVVLVWELSPKFTSISQLYSFTCDKDPPPVGKAISATFDFFPVLKDGSTQLNHVLY